ncbi:MAG TPA: hypothetical protein VF025_13090 [Gaiellaceae bacterium]
MEFAAIVMFAVGFFRIISAIAYFADSHKVNDLTNGLFSGHTWGWGVWDLLIATVAILAGLSLLAGGGFGRVVGYIWAVLVIVQGFVVIGIAPWYAAAMIALAAFVIYGLATSSRSKEAYS